MLIAFASASEAMMKCVPLSKIAVVALSPGRGFAAALPTLMPVRFTDQYFCTAAQLWEGLSTRVPVSDEAHVRC